MEQSPDHSDEEQDINEEFELESDEDLRVSTKPEHEKEESVSELRQIVCGITEVLRKLRQQHSNC